MRLGLGRFVPLLGILVSATLQPASIWAITIRDDTPDASYLALAAQPDYAPVGTFVASSGNTSTSSSATLIAPDWILTSAHSLFGYSSGTFTINGVSYDSTQFLINPNWNASELNNAFPGNDFGLVHLSSIVSGITPAQLYSGTADLALDGTLTGTFVGYGSTGTGLNGFTTLDNQKRAFQNIIDGNFGNPTKVLGVDFDNPHNPADSGFGSQTPLTLEGCVAPGDSGGGVFITVGSQTYLEGVISFNANADGTQNSDYGDASGFGRVSTYLPWIVSSIPEPPAYALLMAGATLGLFFHRRRRQPKV